MIETIVDFIQTYADRCHHGKEEDILFRKLEKKELTPDHQKIMAELIDEHRQGRKMLNRLIDSKNRYFSGNDTALSDIKNCFTQLTDFYPLHIEKEDKHFFYPCMDYFEKEEKDIMLKEFWDFDRSLIHEKYEKLLEKLKNL